MTGRFLALALGLGVAVPKASGAEVPLTPALTPSRDATALQEAGEAFARTLTRLSGVRVSRPSCTAAWIPPPPLTKPPRYI